MHQDRNKKLARTFRQSGGQDFFDPAIKGCDVMRHSVLLVEGQLLNQDSLRDIIWRLYEGMYDTALFYTIAESIKRRHLSSLSTRRRCYEGM
jgi:hypothetical protein